MGIQRIVYQRLGTAKVCLTVTALSNNGYFISFKRLLVEPVLELDLLLVPQLSCSHLYHTCSANTGQTKLRLMNCLLFFNSSNFLFGRCTFFFFFLHTVFYLNQKYRSIVNGTSEVRLFFILNSTVDQLLLTSLTCYMRNSYIPIYIYGYKVQCS